VALGECTHGSREIFQMKHRLLEFLASEMGFTILSVEGNMPEARRVNDYVTEGKGDPAAVLRGMYFSTWRSSEAFAMVQWMRQFNRQAAERQSGQRVEFAGFDMQYPVVAADLVRDYVESHDRDWRSKIAAAVDALHGARPRDPVGLAIGTFPIAAARGKRVVVSGWIKTENVTGGYAGLLWRADTATKTAAALQNMYHSGPRGTTDWQRYEFAVDVPADATVIEFGMLLEGKGKAWFDDLEVTLDGVRYEPGGEFDFTFEQDHLVGFHATSTSYQVRVVPERHGGRQSLGFETIELGEDTSVRARELWQEIEAHLRHAIRDGDSSSAARWAAQNARIVNQALAMNAAPRGQGHLRRDESMAENVKWLLKENPRAKIVLWAHNGHVRRADGSMGDFLSAQVKDEMVVVGFATGSGTYGAWGSRGYAEFPLQPSPADSAEALFAATGRPRFVLDLRLARDGDGGKWFGELHGHRLIGGGEMKEQFPARRALARDYDLVVWIEHSTASMPLALLGPADNQ
jgi:erythromycin esterase-like protein